MAEDLSVPRPVLAQPASTQPRRRAHVRKFAVAYAVLALIAIGAAGALVWAIGLDRKDEQAWSDWKPTAEGEARLWQIVDHVQPRYYGVDHRPIVRLLVAPPYISQVTEQGVTRVEIDGVIVKYRASDRSDARAGVFPPGEAYMYILCSTGGNCALTRAQNASPTLGIALQREVLELALYTFKYNDNVDQLLFFLPPFQTIGPDGRPTQQKIVAYLERDDLRAALARPIDRTLPGSPGEIDKPDRDAVSAFIRPKLFTFEPEQGPQGLTLLTLTPYAGH
jgi:hypothetical protein